MKKKGFNIKTILVGIILFSGFIVFNVKRNNKIEKALLDKINSIDLSLQGKISGLTKISYNCAIVGIEIDTSNYSHLDERHLGNNYFIVIRSNVAELFIEDAPELRKGDSISILNDKINIYRDKERIEEVYVTLVSLFKNENFFNEVRRAHKL